MYLLDTNICIDLQKAQSKALRRFSLCQSQCYIPTLVLAELYKGIYCSRRIQSNLKVLARLTSVIDVLEFDNAAAEDFGKIQDALRRMDRPTGDIDALLAGMARSRNDILVTHNTRHFKYIPELQLEDWL